MNNKDTIYIDVDDEITSIIDKVQNTQESIVALVLPKRAAMLQSSVNMKLLKRAADKAKKNVVLITTEAGLLPLASSVGLFVAKNLQSKPEIPKATVPIGAIDELIKADDQESTTADFDSKAVAGVAVGELATDDLMTNNHPAKPELTPLPYKRASNEEESVMLDNSEKTEEKEADNTKEDKKAKDKNLKVPNFDKFRKGLIIAVVLIILLVVGFIFANRILPKAVITISTNTSSVNSSLALTLSPSTSTLNTNQLIVPTKIQQSPQTASKQVPTTGTKNEGQVATGTVSFVATVNSSSGAITPSTIPAGIGISSGGLTFITQQPTVFSGRVHNCGTNCDQYYSNPTTTTITAQSPGSKYNLGSNSQPAPFTSTYQDSNNSGTVYSATGSTTQGTDNLVTVVSQTDITNAAQAIAMPPTASVKSTLTSALETAGYYPVQTSYSAGTPAITQSANVGDQATTVTVTEAVTYTMFGVHESDLSTLVTASVDQQINTKKQSIQDLGLGKATFTGVTQSPTQATLTMQTSSTVGPLLNIAQIKSQIAGLKKGDLETLIEQNPGVTSVSVKYSPFWVSSTPKNTSKITIKVKKAS